MLVPRGATAARVGSVTLGKGRDKGKGKGKGRQDEHEEAPAAGKTKNKDTDEAVDTTKKRTKRAAVAKKLMSLLMSDEDDDDEDKVKTPRNADTKEKPQETPSTSATTRSKTTAAAATEEESPYDAWAKKAGEPREEQGPREPRERYTSRDTWHGKPKWYFPAKAVQGEDEHGGLILKSRDETYARCEIDWGGIHMRTIAEDMLLTSMKGLHEVAECRILAMAVTQAEADTMVEGGSAVILQGDAECLRHVQAIMERVCWNFSATSLQVFSDMIDRFVEWTGHGCDIRRRRNGTKQEADALRQERDTMAQELAKLKQEMQYMKETQRTGTAPPVFQTAGELLQQQQQQSPVPLAQTTPTSTGSPGWRKVTSKQDDRAGDWRTGHIDDGKTPEKTPPSSAKSSTSSTTRRRLTKVTGLSKTAVKKDAPRYTTRRLTRHSGNVIENEHLSTEDVSMEDSENLHLAGDAANTFTQPWGPPSE
jgi:hypothetical protein